MAKQEHDRLEDLVMKQAVAELPEEGEIQKHARRALSVYRERREWMATCLDKYLGERVIYQKPVGGLAYWVKFKEHFNPSELTQLLLKEGVKVTHPDEYSFNGELLNAFRLSYASLTNQQLEEGMKIIGCIL